MQFGKLESLELRDIWKKEAIDFTPWLAENLPALGECIGIELELETREADVGDFSLDLLAKDLGTGGYVVIENQLTATDHDHLGKLITYASGFDASTVIWIAESFRDEHRQAIEWLNQHTDNKTNFFAVIVEIFKIDGSKPAYKFRPITFPNQWQKAKRHQTSGSLSPRSEAYRKFFQKLIDDLREKHRFTGARLGQPQSWYSFSSGTTGVTYGASFAQGAKFRVELYIDKGNQTENKKMFDYLFECKDDIEKAFGSNMSWERLDEKRASRIAVYKDGTIDDKEAQLFEHQAWAIEKLLKFKHVLPTYCKDANEVE
jgi:uncharacterized protein DUF4268